MNSDSLCEVQNCLVLTILELFYLNIMTNIPKIYFQRLGVTFTDFHSESMYNKEAKSLTERLKQTGILQTDRFV